MCYRILTPLLLLPLLASTGAAEDPVDFNRDVRPLLSDNCFRCHGPDAAERPTDFRLDDRESAFAELTAGGFAIVPGDASASEIIRRLTTPDLDEQMPPQESGKSLSDAEIAQIRQWIDQGAAWNDHWAFIAPVRPSLPALEGTARVQNPIDLFVRAKLAGTGLQPASGATRTAEVRRVTLDLTGLVPTPAEIDAYIADPRPDAYDRLVDRLLNSPRYGEHQGRYWLDAARYGDTHGLHLDNERSIWPYRDWVIQAFNANLPFDTFTIEQLAGDLLANADLDQRVATGFNRCNVSTSEGGSIAAEYLVRYAVDRVETTATTWMGLTAGCAVCHDHKFDPLSQTEFYQLFAYFYSQTEKAMDGNAKTPPPSLKVPTIPQQRKSQQLDFQLTELETDMLQRRRQFASRVDEWSAEYLQHASAVPWPQDSIVHCALDEMSGVTVSTNSEMVGKVVGKQGWDSGRLNGAFRFDGDSHIEISNVAEFDDSDAFSVTAWVYRDESGHMAILSRMDDVEHHRGYDVYVDDRGHLFVHLVHTWPSNAIRINATQPLRNQKWHHVGMTYDGSGKANGAKLYVDGELQETKVTHDSLSGTIKNQQPLRLGRRSTSAPWVGMLDEIRIYDRNLPPNEIASLADSDPIRDIASIPPESRTEPQQARLIDHFMSTHVAGYRSLLHNIKRTQERHRKLQSQFPSTLVMQDLKEPRQAYVLVRGEYDKPSDAVQPNVPGILPPLPVDAAPNRLSLAEWLVDETHPLTARVIVNRIWQQYFGIGLVATTEDFGSQGEWPSHPELLDWLAVELIESDWNLKRLHRLIATSATYRQSSQASAEAYQADPQNRLLSRGPRFRLDAEAIRDNALYVAGLLVERQGGKSVRPYQPAGLWKVVGYTTSNTANFQRDEGAALYRRSMYTFWKRTSPPPSMQIFDAPSREVCTVKRARTNTPGAALALMNDVQMIEAARHMAERMLDLEGSDHQRLQFGFRLTTSRNPEPKELQILQDCLDRFREDYRQHPKDAADLVCHGASKPDEMRSAPQLAAWTMVASTIMNLDETIMKE